MLRLLCLIALSFAAVSAQGCCGPDRWEGYFDAAVGFAESSERADAVLEHHSIHYDGVGKRVVDFIEKYQENTGERRKFQILDNFETKRRMEVEEGACTITELTHEMRDPCTPPDAEYLHTYYVGVSGDALEVDSFAFPTENEGESYHVRLTKDCVPFSGRRYYASQETEGFSFAWLATYTGVREGISDDSVFETPSECLHVNPKILLKHTEKDALSVFFHKM